MRILERYLPILLWLAAVLWICVEVAFYYAAVWPWGARATFAAVRAWFTFLLFVVGCVFSAFGLIHTGPVMVVHLVWIVSLTALTLAVAIARTVLRPVAP